LRVQRARRHVKVGALMATAQRIGQLLQDSQTQLLADWMKALRAGGGSKKIMDSELQAQCHEDVEILDDDSCVLMVVDGLGHGAAAADAARAAIDVLRVSSDLSPGRILELAHTALRSTRGAAVAVGRLQRRSQLFTYAASAISAA
jgi:hypothetical protein